MGSSYDFFGIESHPKYQNISNQQKKNRMLLRKVMLTNGFKPYENEWWHFTLKKEPFPNTYFEFSIK
jgi:D-alanyl-D-alanine dipeptidase